MYLDIRMEKIVPTSAPTWPVDPIQDWDSMLSEESREFLKRRNPE